MLVLDIVGEENGERGLKVVFGFGVFGLDADFVGKNARHFGGVFGMGFWEFEL